MDENNYGKAIPIELGLDTKGLEDKIDALLDALNTQDSGGGGSSGNDDDKSSKKDDEKQAKKAAIRQKFITDIKSAGSSFITALKSAFTDAWSELQDIVSYSTMTNEDVRDLKLGYGFSSSQAYGFDKALSVTGIGSMEDLMWANDTQLAQFKKSFDKYSKYYEETMTPEYVAKQIEFQSEMEMFKQDIQNEIISFFMDHKDKIIFTMNTLIDFAEFAIEALGWIVDNFTSGDTRNETQAKRDAQAILSSYTNSPTNNINTTNNFNNVSESDKTWLTNSVQLAYKQSITMLNNS